MLHYHVRDILAMPKNERWAIPDTDTIMLTFDDGEQVEVATRPTIISSYYWELPNAFPGLRLTKDHHFLDEDYGKSSHLKMATRVFWDTFMAANKAWLCGEAQHVMWDMTRMIWDIGNEIYNDTVSMLGSYAMTMDLDDLLDVILQPDVVRLKQEYREGKISIDEEHKQIFTAVRGDENLSGNAFNCGFRADLSKPRSFYQSIGSRAFVPDINGVTSETPIYDGYGDGLKSTYDRLVESRSASIALYMQSGPLEASEYNNRMSQLMTMVVQQVHYGDCGGAHAIEWKVEEGDLPHLVGKCHMVDGQPRVIFGDETDLVGTTIKLRSMMTCDNHDPAHPCSVCVGINALTAPPRTNLGYYLSTEPLARISQTILSIKHLLASTTLSKLEIKGEDNHWLRVSDETDQFTHLTKEVLTHPTAVRFGKEATPYLNDILAVDDVYDLSLETLSSLDSIQIVLMDNKRLVRSTHTIPTTVAGKGSQLTYAFLEYMKQVGWEPVGESYEVNLENWNVDEPFLSIPRRGEDIMEVLSIATDFLHSPTGAKYPRAIDYKKPGPAARAFLYGLREKIFVNFSHVEIFVKALMARGDTSYALPVGGEPFRFLRMKDAIKNRGAGAAMAFEDQKAVLSDPATYLRFKDEINGTQLDAYVE